MYRPLGEHHKAAQYLKEQVPVLVCIGNPPYDRHAAADDENRMMTGGWVRYGDLPNGADAILRDFTDPVKEAKKGGQLKNLYNLYVYFWRWALWKVFEHQHAMWLDPGSGVVSYISASSFLDGDAFLGMREYIRRKCDEVWVIDLGGEGRGSRQDENVFAIKIPVAITIAVQYTPRPMNPKKLPAPARVNYCRIEGTRAAKLARLESIAGFADLKFQRCPDGWHAPFRPQSKSPFFNWPKLIDLMPWQQSGAQIKRTWPICYDRATLGTRWQALLQSTDRAAAFKETRDRTIDSVVDSFDAETKLSTIRDLEQGVPMPEVARYGFRSFDRQWVIADPRVGDYFRPPLWRSSSNRQLYFGSLLTTPLGRGLGMTVSAYVPDLHYFSGRGAKDILPLYRDGSGKIPNIHPDLLKHLAGHFGRPVGAEDVGAYVYAILGSPAYTARFLKELNNRDVRVPLSLDKRIFVRAVDLGRQLIYLHTFGERFAEGQKWPRGVARCVKAVPTEDGLPDDFSYDPAKRQLRVGSGVFEPVSAAVFDLEVSGFKVVKSWLGYRVKASRGKRSSTLDLVVPSGWTAESTTELLSLLHLLEESIGLQGEQERILSDAMNGPLLTAEVLAPVPNQYRDLGAQPAGQKGFEI